MVSDDLVSDLVDKIKSLIRLADKNIKRDLQAFSVYSKNS